MRALLFLLLAAPPQDTLRLPALQNAAVDRDPRARQAALQARATELRLRTLSAERLPTLTVRGEGIHQSEVATIPIALPGVEVPQPPRDRVEASLDVQWTLWDGGERAGRRGVEEAGLEAARAELAAELYPLRMEVNEAFFAAAGLQERIAETTMLTRDLEARLAMLRAGVRAGTALPGDTAAIRAELLSAEQSRAELAADRRAALRVLALLTGREVDDTDVLALPEPATGAVEAARSHPRYAAFAARRARLNREAELVSARSRPQLSALGQLAYGRPGFAQFRDDLHEYWLAGVRVRWTPWDWGTAERERAEIAIRREIVDTEEAAFSDRLRRDVQDELQSMERLEAALRTDATIIALREQVERQARIQFDERAITAAAYVDVRTDLQEARIARQRHRVELARSRARYLTTLGIDP